MNILMFASRFYPYIGGVEKHTLCLAKELTKNGHNVTIITEDREEKYKDFEEYENIKIYRFTANKFWGIKKLRILKIWYYFLKNIKTLFSANVIHCHDFSTFFNWYLPFKIILPWKKVYVTFHGWEGQVPPKKSVVLKRKLTEWLTRGNICIGDFIKKWYFTKPDIVTYGATYLPQTNSNESIIEEKAIYVGRLEKDTGIEIYVDTLIYLKKKYNINLKSEICGDGTLLNELKEKCKQNYLDVMFHGFVNDPDKYIKGCKYCFTSGYLAILECMVQKKLVVSVYDNELKKDYLCMIPECDKKMVIENNCETLGEKIYSITQNNEYYWNLVNEGHRWAKNYTWQEMANNYILLWEN